MGHLVYDICKHKPWHKCQFYIRNLSTTTQLIILGTPCAISWYIFTVNRMILSMVYVCYNVWRLKMLLSILTNHRDNAGRKLLNRLQVSPNAFKSRQVRVPRENLKISDKYAVCCFWLFMCFNLTIMKWPFQFCDWQPCNNIWKIF